MPDAVTQFSDREIAEDILTSHKYLANYYYAPAILESQNPELRSVFQQVYNDTQAEARQVFDYLNSKGWYPVKPADNADLTELKNVADRSRNTVNFIAQGGQSQTVGMQEGQWGGYQGQTWQTGTPGYNPQSQPWGGQGTGWQTGVPYGGWQRGGWTGTQYGEGQGGMGPSSVAQWARWGGQPSWQGFGGTGYGYGTAGQWGSYGAGWQQPTAWGTAGQAGWHGGRWTGTEAGEGQPGMGPSSVAQWSRWGGQPSWSGYGQVPYGGTGFTGGRQYWQPETGQRPFGGGMYQGGYGTGGFGGYAQTGGSWYGGPGSYQVNLPDWARQDRPELGQERG